jgi:hypothetical protein
MANFLLLTYAIMLISCPVYSQVSSDLSEYRWQNRLILLFAPQAGDSQYQKQRELLLNDQPGLNERDLLIFSILPNRVISDNDSVKVERAAEIRKRYKIPRAAFSVLLIGKDGSEKMRSNKVVPREELYALIDAMPMRRQEMQED